MISASIIKPNLSKGTLSKLTDTSISSPSNGQVLGYNSTSSKWENQTLSGGNTKLKTRYSISYSSWSSSSNSDGYYTYSLTLSPTIDTSISPDVLIAGSSDTLQPTDTHKTMFNYVERCYLSGSSLTLYAKTKPTSDFYIWVEGVAGSGSGSIVGNVIQPNGAVSVGGGIPTIDEMTSVTPYSTNRVSVKAGGYKQIGNKVYVNIWLKLKFNLATTSDLTARLWDTWDAYIYFPKPKNNAGVIFQIAWMYKNTASGSENRYYRCSTGPAWIYTTGALKGELSIGSIKDLDGTDSTKEIIAIITGEYDV